MHVHHVAAGRSVVSPAVVFQHAEELPVFHRSIIQQFSTRQDSLGERRGEIFVRALDERLDEQVGLVMGDVNAEIAVEENLKDFAPGEAADVENLDAEAAGGLDQFAGVGDPVADKFGEVDGEARRRRRKGVGGVHGGNDGRKFGGVKPLCG
jgi:hypothetical protein